EQFSDSENSEIDQSDQLSPQCQPQVGIASNNLSIKEKNMANEKDKLSGSIEEALLRELRFGGIDKDNLKELVGIVAGFHRAGLRKFKVFPKGIPVVDGLRVSGVLDASDATRILSEILSKTPRLTAVVAFPYGIPWPEIFRVRIDIGATAENGPVS